MLNINVLPIIFCNNVGPYINSQQTINKAVDIHAAYLVCSGHNELAFFDSDIAVNYTTFGSEHQKFVGNPDRHHDIILP